MSAPDRNRDPHDDYEGEEHEYDGIIERDNPLPLWWLATFIGAVIFAFGYFYHYEKFRSGPSTTEEFQAEMAARSQKKGAGAGAVSAEALVAMSKDAAAVAEGKTTFMQMCASCHGDKGEGKIGPNLTDSSWIHGGKPEAIYKTVSTGVLDKGMPAWEPTIGATKTQRVTAYIVSIRNTNVPGKAAQGTEEKD